MRRTAIWVFVFGTAILAWGYWSATRDPIVRTARVHVANWPDGAPPVRVALLSDVHVAGPDMPPSRAARLMRQVSALKPELVLIAGDMISEKQLATKIYSAAEAVEPLRQLRAPLGVIAVLGNHDYWADENGFRIALRNAGIHVLNNEAVQRGPIVVGGIGDEITGHANIRTTYQAMAGFAGPRILVTHDPDIIPDLPVPVAAVFAGHTHCGQARWPWGTPIANVSRYGMRFQCGDITDAGQRLFVTAGLGTSVIWLRYGTRPDVWLVTLGP